MLLNEAAQLVDKNSELQTKMREDPVRTLETMGAMPLQTDKWIYRGVIVILGLVIIMTVAGSVLLSFYERSIPEGVFVLAGTCAGAMAGLLAPSPNKG